MNRPAVSVIVVSDYNSSGEPTWNDERACLNALAVQDLTEPYEVIVSDDEAHRAAFPDDLLTVVQPTRVIFSAARGSYERKNAGARAATSPIVAILDADCRPDPDWLRVLLDTFRAHPEVSVISGRTLYEGRDLESRVFALLTRSYLDPGARGVTLFTSNNAAGFRREILLQHPLPEKLGAFASRIQSEAMLRDGCTLWFEPGMRVVHGFEGWRREADIRRNIGYGTVATRITERQMPYAALVRLGLLATPVIAAGKLLNTWRDCIRCGSSYGVRWYELPVAFGAAVMVNLMEIPGMLAAYRHRSIQETAYR